MPRSADDARAFALHDRLDFLDVDHRGVPGRGHGERAVCRAVFHGGLWTLALEEAIRKTRGEAIAAAHAVVDLEILAHHRLVEVSSRVQDGRPVVEGGGLRVAQRSR